MAKITSNFTNEDKNPCIAESKKSMQCLEEKLYDYSQCTLYFENYKRCKKFWASLSRKRKQADIHPALPTKAERDKIMKLKKEGVSVLSAED